MEVESANTILYCRQWRETVAFYRLKLGLAVNFENDWFVEFELRSGANLSVADASRATIGSADGAGLTVTLKVTDIAAAQAQLQREGIITTSIQKKWGAWQFYCYDPEGHRLEFWSTGDRPPNINT